MDQSTVGMAKAGDLAAVRGVPLVTAVGDLAHFDLGADKWDNIVSIFGHLPGPLRRDVHRRVVEALRPGGIFLLEAFSPGQLGTKGTGGPSDPDMLLTVEKLTAELAGLEIMFAREIMRPVNEGDYHKGDCAVVQFVARKGGGE